MVDSIKITDPSKLLRMTGDFCWRIEVGSWR